MNLIQYIITYLMIGVAVNAGWDLLTDISKNEEIRLTMAERVAMCFIWPIYVSVFLYNFIKTIVNGNRD